MSTEPPSRTTVARWMEGAIGAARASPTSRTVRLAPGGVRVTVNLTGEALTAALAPALLPEAPQDGFRPLPGGEHPLAAELWSVDGGAPGAAALPRLPWCAEDHLPSDELRGSREPPLVATCSTVHGTLNAVDTDAQLGVQWFRDHARTAPWEPGAPVRDLLRWTLAPRGLHLVHGAVVGTEAGGLLLCGPGGAGKTTTSLACLTAGLAFLADDYCLVRTEPEPTAHALFRVAKADATTLGLLPALDELAAGARRDWRGKAHLPVGDVLHRELPLRGLLFPVRAARTGEPSPVRAREVLTRLIPATLAQLPAAQPVTVAALAGLARALPAFSMPVGPDLREVPEAIARLLDRLAVAAAA